MGLNLKSELPSYGIVRPDVTFLKITVPTKVRLPIRKHPVFLLKTGDGLERNC